MQLGMIGLGRMGADMTRRLLRGGHRCAVYDVDPAAVARVATDGATPCASPQELVAALAPPRALWLMVPAAFVDATLERFAPLLAPGDVLIDGGNSRYRDDLVRARELALRGLHYLDVGTSGGVFGLERGYCLMIGGEAEVVRAARADLRDARAERGLRAAHARPRGRPARRRARLPALRSARGRALRQDGAQRHRVRTDGRLRRGLQHPAPRRTPARASRATTPRPRRSSIPSTSSTSSICRRSRSCGGAAA